MWDASVTTSADATKQVSSRTLSGSAKLGAVKSKTLRERGRRPLGDTTYLGLIVAGTLTRPVARMMASALASRSTLAGTIRLRFSAADSFLIFTLDTTS